MTQKTKQALRPMLTNGSLWVYSARLARTLECPYSSPMRIMGTPWDSRSAAARLRICLWRRRSTFFLAVSPSAPQFQVRLWLSPSLCNKASQGPSTLPCRHCQMS